MRTYPIPRADGTLNGFEISNVWVSFRSLKRILRSVEGVSDILRKLFSDDRLTLKYRGEPCVVNEPFGDNSRYWIGPENPGISKLDIDPIHEAFKRHRNPIAQAWSWAVRARDS